MEYHLMSIPVFRRKRQIHYLLGKTERVPYVWLDLFKYEWLTTGKILLKGYFKQSFVLYTLFEEVGMDDLLSSLFPYLSNDEANMLKGYLPKSQVLMIFQVTSFMNFLNN